MLANAIVFIASDEASFITGHGLNGDGGKTANGSYPGAEVCSAPG
jgi:NAD(P)-dependent dehydrogenase (short-subunit alcohol dehydrogenase family)